MPDLVEVLIEEGATEAMPGIGEQGIYGSTADGVHQLIHAGFGREIRFDGGHVDAKRAKLVGGRLDLRLVGGDDQVVSFLGAFARQLIADAT